MRMRTCLPSLPSSPRPENSLRISFRVETSTDLVKWTSDEVSLSGLMALNRRTPSVPFASRNRYLSLMVGQL